jgi:hypothetical protein
VEVAEIALVVKSVVLVVAVAMLEERELQVKDMQVDLLPVVLKVEVVEVVPAQ